MKRKKTQLEINLIEKGWQLDHKTYTGKHSDKVDNYVYEKTYTNEHTREDGKIVVTSWSARVLLDSKREHIEDVLIKSPLMPFVNSITCIMVVHKIREIEKEVDECYPKSEKEELGIEEQVEIAEAIGGSNE